MVRLQQPAKVIFYFQQNETVGSVTKIKGGITKREYFAIEMLKIFVSKEDNQNKPRINARLAVEHADDLISILCEDDLKQRLLTN